MEGMNALQVDHLSFAYPDGRPALRDISFVVSEGDRVGLIGPNGAGKSTLLLHLNGLLPERATGSATVRVFGKPIGRNTLEETRRKVGLLFQNPDDQIICPTVFDDVAFGPRQLGKDGLIPAIVRRALEQVGLSAYERRPPHQLSHGEKRRVCIAGLLACAPQVLLLDEPTSDLDPRGRRELKALLKTLPLTTVIASHDLDLVADLCSSVLLLDEGRLVKQGPVCEILSDEALMLEHGLERPHVLGRVTARRRS
jgi:cobalt/nickel transport system ATP-binding protein